MLRFKVLASVVPLFVAAVFARGDFLPGARPCVAIGEGSVQITSLPWQAQSQVSFTRDPARNRAGPADGQRRGGGFRRA